MKKLMYLLVVGVLFTFTACGGGETEACADDCIKECCAGETEETTDEGATEDDTDESATEDDTDEVTE